MSDNISNMYGNNDEDETVPSNIDPSVQILGKGPVVELQAGGQKVSIIDPLIVQQLDATVRRLQQQVLRLEQELRTALSRVSRIEASTKAIVSELDNKVSYARD